MTNALGSVGLAWYANGGAPYDPQRSDLDVHFEITEGLDELPVVRGADSVIPFLPGRLPALRYADVRPLILTGIIGSSGVAPRAAYRAYVDDLKRHFDPVAGVGALVVTMENATTRWIRAVPRNLIGGSGFGSELRAMSLELEALDPYWYSAWGTLAMDAGYAMDTGLTLDASAEVIVLPPANAVDVDTLGSAQVRRIIARFVGPSTSGPGIEATMPDGSIVGFQMVTSLLAGQTLVVDNLARTVLLGATSIRSAMNLQAGNRYGEYMRFPAGPTTIRVLGLSTETHIQFNPTWS